MGDEGNKQPPQIASPTESNPSTILEIMKKFLPASLFQAIIDTERLAHQLFSESVDHADIQVEGLGGALDTFAVDQHRNIEEFGHLFAEQVPTAANHLVNASDKLKDTFRKDV